MAIIRKSVPLTIRKNIKGEDEIVITTPSPDRGGDRVFPEGAMLDNYNKNPIVMWLHDYRGTTPAAGIPIAKCPYLKVTQEGIVAGPPVFLDGDPFAMRVKNAWEKGFIRTASIGFNALEDPVGNEFGGWDYKKWEMLEWSLVPIPMNAEACRQAKSLGMDDLIEKSVDFNQVLEKRQMYSACWQMMDTLENCIYDTLESKKEANKTATIEKTIDDFRSNFLAWVKKAIEAGLFSSDPQILTESFQKFLSRGTVKNQKTGQKSIGDDLEYCLTVIKSWDLNEENQTIARSIYQELKSRLAGNDIPVEDKSILKIFFKK